MVLAILPHACLPKPRRRQGRLGPAAIRPAWRQTPATASFLNPEPLNPRHLSRHVWPFLADVLIKKQIQFFIINSITDWQVCRKDNPDARRQEHK
jgi:hypothetical protein